MHIYLPVLFAAAACLYFLRYVGIMPDNDYWADLNQLLTSNGFHLTFQTLYSHNNEHIIALPKLIYLANALLTGGDNRVLAGIVWILSLAVGLLLASALRDTLRSRIHSVPRRILFAFGCVAGGAAFTPLAAHNFFLGMSGIAWISANLLTLTALYVQYRNPVSYQARAWAILLCLLAAQSYSTGVPALFLLGIQAVLQRDAWRRGAVILLLGVIVLVVFFLQQTVPSAHGPRTFAPLLDASFVAIFIGGGLTSHPDLAGVWGALGLLLFAWLAIRTLWRQEGMLRSQAFWLTVGAYAVLAGLMAAIGRAEAFGIAGAAASRYATIPALFWVAVLGLAIAARAPESRDENRSHLATLALAVSVVVLTVIVGGIRQVELHIVRAALKPGAALSVYLGAHDIKLLRVAVTPATQQLTSIRSELSRVRHVPFNGHFSRCPQLGSSITPSTDKLTSPPKGHMDGGEWLHTNSFVKLRGWVANGDDSVYNGQWTKPHCIAIADAAGVVRGLGVAGLPRPDVAAVLHSPDTRFGWVGYAKITNSPTTLFAYARDSLDSHWHPLGNSLRVTANPVTRQ